jgi:hypothetical protein
MQSLWALLHTRKLKSLHSLTCHIVHLLAAAEHRGHSADVHQPVKARATVRSRAIYPCTRKGYPRREHIKYSNGICHAHRLSPFFVGKRADVLDRPTGIGPAQGLPCVLQQDPKLTATSTRYLEYVQCLNTSISPSKRPCL